MLSVGCSHGNWATQFQVKNKCKLFWASGDNSYSSLENVSLPTVSVGIK